MSSDKSVLGDATNRLAALSVSPLRTPTKDAMNESAEISVDDDFERCLADDWQPTFDALEDEEPAPNLFTESQMAAAIEKALSAERALLESALRERDEAIGLSEKVRQEIKKMNSVAEQQRSDLRAMEEAFGKLKQRYEQSKEIAARLKDSDERSREELAKTAEENKHFKDTYQKLKAHAQDKLKRANSEIVRVREINEQQFTVLTAKQLRAEFERSALAQKLMRSNQELSALRDIVTELSAAIAPNDLEDKGD